MSFSTGPDGTGRGRAMRPSGGTPENARAGSGLRGSPGAGGARPAGLGLIRCRRLRRRRSRSAVARLTVSGGRGG